LLCETLQRLYTIKPDFHEIGGIKVFTGLAQWSKQKPPLRVGLKGGIDIGTLVDLDSMINFDDVRTT